MAKRSEDINVGLVATDDASKVITDVGKKADKLDGETAEVILKADDKAEPKLLTLEDKVNKLDQETAEVIIRADIRNAERDLLKIDGLMAKAKTEGDLELLIQAKDDATARLEDVLATTKKLGDEGKINLENVGVGAGGAREHITKMRDSADQSRSVLANMVGNSAQDLGELGGVAGSAGVAVGQLFEYAVDGNIALRNLAGVAGPLALVTVAAMGIAAGMERIKQIDALEAKKVEIYVKALQKGEDGVKALADELRKAGEIKFSEDGLFGNDWFGRVSEAKYAVANAGLTFDEFAEIAHQGEAAIDAWGDSAVASGKNAEDVKYAVEAMKQEFKAQGEAANEAAGMNMLNERSVKAVDEAMVNWIKNSDPVKGMPDEFAAVAEGLKGVEENGVATQEATDALNAIMEATGMTMEEVFDAANDLSDGVDDAGASMDSAAAAAERMRRTTETLDQQWQQLQGTLSEESAYLSLQDSFAAVKSSGEAAWISAAEGAADAGEKARNYQGDVVRLKEQVASYGQQIGLLPKQVETLLNLTDRGDIGEMERRLTILTRNRDVSVRIQSLGGAGYGALQGARASGGPALAGQRIRVGEFGVEEIVMPATGDVISNSELRNQNTSSTVVQNYYTTINNPAGKPTQTAADIRRYNKRNGIS